MTSAYQSLLAKSKSVQASIQALHYNAVTSSSHANALPSHTQAHILPFTKGFKDQKNQATPSQSVPPEEQRHNSTRLDQTRYYDIFDHLNTVPRALLENPDAEDILDLSASTILQALSDETTRTLSLNSFITALIYEMNELRMAFTVPELPPLAILRTAKSVLQALKDENYEARVSVVQNKTETQIIVEVRLLDVNITQIDANKTNIIRMNPGWKDKE